MLFEEGTLRHVFFFSPRNRPLYAGFLAEQLYERRAELHGGIADLLGGVLHSVDPLREVLRHAVFRNNDNNPVEVRIKNNTNLCFASAKNVVDL